MGGQREEKMNSSQILNQTLGSNTQDEIMQGLTKSSCYKVDTVKKDEVLTFIAAYKDLYDFDEIIPASALRGENADTIVEEIFKYFPEGPMY